jgi:glycosyltransferase involved in cell wall biosynthesis
VILPVHNERDNLASLVGEIEQAMGGRPHEIVAVDDGSTDGSSDELERLAAQEGAVRVVRLGCRAGQSAALAAGFDAALGDLILTMDADGQNDPRDAEPLIAALERDPALGAVVGYRVHRRDSPWKRTQSWIANRVRDLVTGDRVRDTGCGLKVMRRDAARRVPRFDGMHRFLPTLIRAQGRRVVELPVSHRPRRHGRSHYGAWDRALRGLRDALRVRRLRRLARARLIEENGI